MERRLSAILAADMVGYSRLMEADEVGTLKRQRAYRTDVMDPAFSKHRGRIFKTTGDGLFAEFSSVVDAVQCAVDIQRAIIELEKNVDDDRRIQYRVGINLGDVIPDADGDIYGDGVNMAARLEQMAEPGGICISGTTYDHLKSQVDVGYEPLGEVQVKNIERPVRAYKIVFDQPSASTPFKGQVNRPARHYVAAMGIGLLLLVSAGIWWWTAVNEPLNDRAGFKLPDRPSVAVLPFNAFSSENTQQYLADGIAEDIIAQLARNSELTVIARPAVSALITKGMGVEEIAREFGVHYVLEGSVRRIGDRLRITAQLIDPGSSKHIWAEQYDSTAASIFEAQDEIVERIVGTLFSEIRETEKSGILRRPPSSLDAYELALRGVARKHRLNPEDSELAREDLSKALELDPDYAAAWLYLGWVEGIAIAFGWASDLGFSDLGDAIKKVEKAIELDPSLATAYQALGILKSWVGDPEGALVAARRSVELGPGDADNLLFLGRALASVGDFDKARSNASHAFELNPLRPIYYDAAMARILWGAGRYQDAKNYSNDCLTKAPGYTQCLIFLIAGSQVLGDSNATSKAVSVLLSQSPNLKVDDAVAGVGFSGDPDANELLAKQLTMAGLSTR